MKKKKDMNYRYWNIYGAICTLILNSAINIFTFLNCDKILEFVVHVSSLILLLLFWNLILEYLSSDMVHVAYSEYI